jgi:hypothetical protein
MDIRKVIKKTKSIRLPIPLAFPRTSVIRDLVMGTAIITR